MRRNLCVILAAGFLLFGCSSSKKDSTASGTSTSTVVVSAQHAAFCADMQTFVDDLENNQKALVNASGVDLATKIQALFASMMPPLQKALASAPAEAVPSLTTLQTAWTGAAGLDPTSPTAQAELGSLAILGPADVRAAMTSLSTYTKTTCGIEFAKQ